MTESPSRHMEDTPAEAVDLDGIDVEMSERAGAIDCDLRAAGLDPFAVNCAALGYGHPELTSATTAALGGDDEAKGWVESWTEADESRSHISAALAKCRPGTVAKLDGKDVLLDVHVEGIGTLITNGRPLRPDWTADPQAAAAQLDACGSSYGVHLNTDGELGSHALGCKSPLCPQCARRKAARRVSRLGPVVDELVARGYQLCHVTLTQPQRSYPESELQPVILTDFERRFCGDSHAAAGRGSAVSGETLGQALSRLKKAMTGLRDGRRTRAKWVNDVAGYVYGIEWTGRHDGHLRWHVHIHILVILRPAVDAGEFWDWLVPEWCRLTLAEHGEKAAAPEAQHARILNAETAEDELREILKYPFKPASLTTAQLVDVLASTKGLRFHHVGGGLHACSKVGKLVRAFLADDVELAGEITEKLTVPEVEMAMDIYEGRRKVEDEPTPTPLFRRAKLVKNEDMLAPPAEYVPLTVRYIAREALRGMDTVTAFPMVDGELQEAIRLPTRPALRRLTRWTPRAPPPPPPSSPSPSPSSPEPTQKPD